MSEQIREQISAFLDGELPASETELLLKRLGRDAELRESFGRYAMIGEALRGAKNMHLTRGFAGRVNGAIDGEPASATATASQGGGTRWWRPVAGAAVAAGVAVFAVIALQQRANTPPLVAATAAHPAPAPALAAKVIAPARNEAVSYTVPRTSGEAPAMMPAARLTNYVFAHSQYPSLLGQRDVLTDLIVDVDEQNPPLDASTAR